MTRLNKVAMSWILSDKNTRRRETNLREAGVKRTTLFWFSPTNLDNLCTRIDWGQNGLLPLRCSNIDEALLTWKVPAGQQVQSLAAHWRSWQTGQRRAGWAESVTPESSCWSGASPARRPGARGDCGSTMDPRLHCTCAHTLHRSINPHTTILTGWKF